jgi:H+/Cl- antiporter ClcA
MVAAATRAPLTAIFMVYEMTDDYRYVVPLMLVTAIAHVTSDSSGITRSATRCSRGWSIPRY